MLTFFREQRFWHGGPAGRTILSIDTLLSGNPLPSAAPDPLPGHQELPQYHVEVETILCGLQMIQMSCIERTLLQTMLKKKSIQTMLKKKVKKRRGIYPAVACLLRTKRNSQEEPSPALTPAFVCGVARGAKNLCPQYSPY